MSTGHHGIHTGGNGLDSTCHPLNHGIHPIDRPDCRIPGTAPYCYCHLPVSAALSGLHHFLDGKGLDLSMLTGFMLASGKPQRAVPLCRMDDRKRPRVDSLSPPPPCGISSMGMETGMLIPCSGQSIRICGPTGTSTSLTSPSGAHTRGRASGEISEPSSSTSSRPSSPPGTRGRPGSRWTAPRLADAGGRTTTFPRARTTSGAGASMPR
ncbi:MAG: hypothetical protein A4E42_00980 [Methanoregulaceae archaeon PtaU1.Bin222]|nr:MAG: hypothetical protein A4E42_00980 [Methanoregulaceae archaeon PtaU1.Bin222]